MGGLSQEVVDKGTSGCRGVTWEDSTFPQPNRPMSKQM